MAAVLGGCQKGGGIARWRPLGQGLYHRQHCHHCGTSGAVVRGTIGKASPTFRELGHGESLPAVVGHGAIHGKTPCRTLAILPSRLRPVSRDGQAA